MAKVNDNDADDMPKSKKARGYQDGGTVDDDPTDLTKHPAYALGVQHAYSGVASRPAGLPDTTGSPTPSGAPTPAPAAGTPGPAGPGNFASASVAQSTQRVPTGVVGPRIPPPAARISPASGTGQLPRGQGPGTNFAANTPPGSDYNLNSGQYVPKTTPGQINGRPAQNVLAEGASKTGVGADYSGGALGVLPRIREAGPTPPVGGTQAVLPPDRRRPLPFEDGGRVTGEVSLPNISIPPMMRFGGRVPRYQDGGEVPPNDRFRKYFGGGMPTPTPTPKPTPAPKKFASGGKQSSKDTVPAMLSPGEVVLNPKQQQKVAVQPNFRQGLNPREQTAMAGMGLPRMRKQAAFNPPKSKMFAGK